MKYSFSNEIEGFKKRYPNLTINEHKQGMCIDGYLSFYKSLNDVPIHDKYNIKISISKSFPFDIPIVIDKDRRIKNDFGHFLSNGGIRKLCLGIESEISIKIQSKPSIIYFVDTFVTNYLYLASYFEKYGTIPSSERAHGNEGILSFYQEYFGISSKKLIISLLGIVFKGEYTTVLKCPCNSEKTLATCFHGNAVRALFALPSLEAIKSDYRRLVS